MRIFLSILALIMLFMARASSDAYAMREPRPLGVDKRIKVMSYAPDEVFKYTGYYGYQTNIEFGEGESIESISMGDTTGWQMIPSGRRLFLKPMDQDATTNMTLITNKRMYFFELHAEEAADISDPNLSFIVRFIYPDEGSSSAIRKFSSTSGPDLTQPWKYNFNYTISGNQYIAPLRIFDDGEFTYFKFKNKNAEVPAFFMVDSEGKEALVNYRVSGEYIVIERVIGQFTLRNGPDIVCVFNEKMPLERKRK